MDLGANAYPVASHLIMVGILLMLIIRVMIAPHGPRMMEAIDLGFRATIAIGALGLIIERLYYVLARLLKPDGIDLWSMHPAPEVLSIVVGLGLYSIMVPMIFAAAATREVAVRRVIVEMSSIVLVWVVLVRVFY